MTIWCGTPTIGLMTWLRKIFGGRPDKKTVSPSHCEKINIQSYGSRILSVPKLDIMGQGTTSPDGHYTLICQDRQTKANGQTVSGRYVLIEGDTVLVDSQMARPHDGKVANNGTHILNDWCASEELTGVFTAFTENGEAIVSRSYTANLLNNGLATNGRLAVCQTCNSPHSPDSSIISVFDLDVGCIVAEWTAESGWADAYEFPEQKHIVRMLRQDRPSLDFTLDGKFLDRNKWLRDEVDRGSLHVIRKALAENQEGNGISIDTLRSGTQVAIKNEDERFRADSYRLLGEIEEFAGNSSLALEAYDNALKINAKVGVARRAKILRRSLSN